MTETPKREWISVAEMQQTLGIGRTKAYELLATGEVPAIKVGRLVRVNRAELDAWAKGNRYRPVASSPAELDSRTAQPTR